MGLLVYSQIFVQIAKYAMEYFPLLYLKSTFKTITLQNNIFILRHFHVCNMKYPVYILPNWKNMI